MVNTQVSKNEGGCTEGCTVLFEEHEFILLITYILKQLRKCPQYLKLLTRSLLFFTL
jgi:hypothetical protein